MYYLNVLHMRESVFVCANMYYLNMRESVCVCVYYLSLSDTSERESVHVRLCL